MSTQQNPTFSPKPDMLQEAEQHVAEFIEKYLAKRLLSARAIDEGYAQLWAATARTVLAGGKRLRPRLLLTSYAAYGGTAFADVLPVAAAIELLHQCLLVHDDIIDHDLKRHGVLNVSGRMKARYAHHSPRPEESANNAAILAGDLLLSSAYDMVMSSQLADELKTTCIQYMSEAMFQVGAGELIDSEAFARNITETDVLKVALYKTASYTFVMPLLIGATLSGIPAQERALLERFGEEIGIAYQLRDDVLGVFGAPKTTGKSNIGDIREGKHTMLMQTAFSRANQAQTHQLSQAFGNPDLTPADAAAVRQIIIDTGALEYTEAAIDVHAGQASQLLGDLSIHKRQREPFMHLVTKVTVRDT